MINIQFSILALHIVINLNSPYDIHIDILLP